jgi:hypothetical protein
LEINRCNSSVLKEKFVLASAEKIKTGRPILRVNSFKTSNQLLPTRFNFCNKAVVKIIINSGVMTVKI